MSNMPNDLLKQKVPFQSIEKDFNELWPELSEEEALLFCWNCTAFPVGDNVRSQLEYYLEKCGKDLQAMLNLADKELHEIMKDVERGPIKK